MTLILIAIGIMVLVDLIVFIERRDRYKKREKEMLKAIDQIRAVLDDVMEFCGSVKEDGREPLLERLQGFYSEMEGWRDQVRALKGMTTMTDARNAFDRILRRMDETFPELGETSGEGDK